MHRGDYGQSAVLNQIECAVPVTGNFERFVDVPFLVLRQIQPGTEMIPARPEYDGQRLLWGIAEKPVDIFDQRFIDCITFSGRLSVKTAILPRISKLIRSEEKAVKGRLRNGLDGVGNASISGWIRGVNSEDQKNTKGQTGWM